MALKDINMLPYDVLETSERHRQVRFWARWLVLALLVAAALYLGCRQWARGQEREMPAASRVREDASRELGRIEELSRRIRALEEKEKTLARIVRAPACWDILAVFAGCLDERTWIESLSLQRDGEQSGRALLNCRGFSMNYETLGLFMARMSNAPGIQGAVLNEAGVETGEALAGADVETAVRFTVFCVITAEGLR